MVIFVYMIKVLKIYFENVVENWGVVFKFENVFYVFIVFVIWLEFVKEFMRKVVIKVSYLECIYMYIYFIINLFN